MLVAIPDVPMVHGMRLCMLLAIPDVSVVHGMRLCGPISWNVINIIMCVLISKCC